MLEQAEIDFAAFAELGGILRLNDEIILPNKWSRVRVRANRSTAIAITLQGTEKVNGY